MIDETRGERHARLDQALTDHLRESERRFNEIDIRFDDNDNAHNALNERIGKMDEKQDLMIAKLQRYDWIARTTMTVLFILGAILGLLSHPSGDSLRAFLGLFK